MLKLLQINSSVNKGSTGRIAEQIGQYFINEGWDSYIAYGRIGNPSKSKTIKIGNKIDLLLHGVNSKLIDNHGLNSNIPTKLFISKIKAIKPDIILIHNLHGYYINYKLLFDFLHQSKIPIIWTLHDCWAFTGHCTFFSDINCEKWKTECNNCPKLKNYPSSLFYDNSNKNFSLKKQLFNNVENMVLVPVSKWLGEKISYSFLSKQKFKVITNGVDLNSFHQIDSYNKITTKYSINNKKIIIGVATTWDIRKGILDYYKLAKILSKEFIIVLVGLSKKQINTLPENIIGIERTESIIELAELYSAAEIVLNLSYQESFGLTTVEGFACGTPGIVYNCTASPELITPETGIIVEPGNMEELIDAINKIANNGKPYYSNNCRKLAETKYNNQIKIGEYFDLAKSLL